MTKGETMVSVMTRDLVVGISLFTSNLKGKGFGLGLGSKGFSNPFTFSLSNTWLMGMYNS